MNCSLILCSGNTEHVNKKPGSSGLWIKFGYNSPPLDIFHVFHCSLVSLLLLFCLILYFIAFLIPDFYSSLIFSIWLAPGYSLHGQIFKEKTPRDVICSSKLTLLGNWSFSRFPLNVYRYNQYIGRYLILKWRWGIWTCSAPREKFISAW